MHSDARAPERSVGGVSRRQILQVCGATGLASVLESCTSGETTTATPPVRSPVPVGPDSTSPAGSVAPVARELCREAWGAKPARPGGRMHTPTRMTLHHTAEVLGDNRNAPLRLRQHQEYHQMQLGWIDIAYHISVDRDGNIYELRAPELVGDTATEYDPTGHFLVVCEGNFETEVVTEAQLNGAAAAFAWAAQTFQLPIATLAGHLDFAATACPGANLYAHLSSGDLRRRVGELLGTGAVDLQPLCGPEAALRVASIEAGR